MIRLIVFIAIFGPISNLYSQGSSFHLGIQSGLNYSFLRGNETLDENHSPSMGFQLGAVATINISSHFSILTTISYDKQRSISKGEINFTDPNGSFLGKEEWKTRFKFNYINIPLLFRYSIRNNSLFVNAGPYLGLLLKEIETTDATSFSPKTISNNTGNFTTTDFGLSFGIGALFPVNARGTISFELRNNLGLSNISALPIYNDGEILTNSSCFLIGLHLNMAK